MPKTDRDPHIDWSRVGKKPRAQIDAEAAGEMRRLGISDKHERLRVHVNGDTYELSIPEVRAIREKLGLSQADFAARFHLSERTVQQWEQRRAMPDMPARILLKVIQQAPDVAARAAADVRREIEKTRRS